MKFGIGPRLLLAHLLLSIIVVGAVELALVPMLGSELTRQLEQRLRQAAEAGIAELSEGATPASAVASVARATGYRISVVDAAGVLVADSALTPERLAAAENHGTREEVVEARRTGSGKAVRDSVTTHERSIYVAAKVGEDVLRATANLANFDKSLAAAHRAVAIAAGLGLLLAGLLGAAASQVAGRTVREIGEAARRIASGDLKNVSVPRGPGELAEVSVHLETLAGQLSTQIGRLTAERDLLDAVLAAMEDAVLVLRPDGRLLLSNGAATRLLSIPRTARGQLLAEALRFPALLDAVQRASSGEPSAVEIELQGPPRRELIGRATPLPRGSEAAVVVVLRDVTELRKLEAMRRDFVASASHELRTPVAAIRGYAETLVGGAIDDPAASKRFLSGLSRQAERLAELIDDLLDLSRVESGGMRLQAADVRAASALRRVEELLRDRAEKKRIQLEVELPDESLHVRADPRAIELVIGNLAENALKYTPEGGRVRISTCVEGRQVRIDVEDTGPGIAPQHLPRLFERFYRVDPSRGREAGGTGLGLAIAKHVAQQSGGDVGVESRLGKGSRFWLRLPLAVDAAA